MCRIIIGVGFEVVKAVIISIKTPMTQAQQSRVLTSNFLKASYPQDQSLSLTRQNSSSSISSTNRSPAKSSTILAQINKSNIKKIQVKNQDHTFRTIFCIIAGILLIILFIDIRSEIERQKHRFQLQGQHCFNQYMTNQCDNAVQVLKQKCKQLQICYSTPVNHKIKVTAIVGHLIGSSVNNLTSSAGLYGSLFLGLFICIILYFGYKSSKQSITIQKH